jgi:hypothetical protein
MTTPETRCGGRLVAALFPAILASLLAGCGGDGSPTSPPTPAPTPIPPAGVRDHLTVAVLAGSSPPGVLHNLYYQPIGAVRATSTALCGTLRFAETRMDTVHPDSGWRGSGLTLFPAFSLPVVTRDDWLIPLERELILSGHGGGGSGRSVWNVIADPGRVWEETADAGYSRAAFPFTLTDNFVGQARNGLATFVFDRVGVSRVAIQITQETAPVSEHLRVDFSALVPVSGDPVCPTGAEAAVAAFERERAARLPLRSWSELPNAQAAWTSVRSGFADTDLSAVALLMDGQLYLQEVATRSGPHPFPEWMRHGIYSVTKTMGRGLSMLYLAQRYGDGVFDERITDHVPELADHPGWQGLTFHHTLNMMTGTVGANSGAAISPFILARSAAAKIAAIHALPDAPPAPRGPVRLPVDPLFRALPGDEQPRPGARGKGRGLLVDGERGGARAHRRPVPAALAIDRERRLARSPDHGLGRLPRRRRRRQDVAAPPGQRRPRRAPAPQPDEDQGGDAARGSRRLGRGASGGKPSEDRVHQPRRRGPCQAAS